MTSPQPKLAQLRSPMPAPGVPLQLGPAAGYQGCVVLIGSGAPGGASRQVALYVDACLPGGIPWTPPNDQYLAIIDVHAGFDLGDAGALESALADLPGGRPPPGGVTVHP
jgi:hypothetical protein